MKELLSLFIIAIFTLYSLEGVAQDNAAESNSLSRTGEIETLNLIVKKLAGGSDFVPVFKNLNEACDSEFISCENGKIIGLDFQYADFRGIIPRELLSMHDLVWINLEYNYLKGGIPNDLSKLPELEELLLTGNHLTGEKPADYKSLKRLKYFDESKNVEYLKKEPIEHSESSMETKSREEILKVVESMPRFPGCENLNATDIEKENCAKEKMLQYIYKNLRYPALARKTGAEGMAVIQFTIETDGSIRNINIVRDPRARCGNAGAWVIDRMNYLHERWTPGKQKGKPVMVLYTLPIKFKLK